jgi:hypothetical protein
MIRGIGFKEMINVALDNRSPFSAETFVVPDKNGQEALLLVIAANFIRAKRGGLAVAENQDSIRPADITRGNPATSSIVYESDIALAKPSTDVLINGYAYSPRGRRTGQVPVQFLLGDIKKALVVSGDRHWTTWGCSDPVPFERLPIVYERAYGGTTPDGKVDIRNPIGVGYAGAVSLDSEVETQLANVEYASQLIRSRRDQPVPAGFGAIGRAWKPRCDFAGTFDEQWRANRFPILPVDFDDRYNQSAPIDQQIRTICGGEDAILINMTPEGLWKFQIPRLDIPVHLQFEDRQELQIPLLDTILIEPEEYKLRMTSRLVIRTVRNTAPLRELIIGHLQPGFLIAHQRRKRYIDSGVHGGSVPGRPFYVL